MTPIPKAAARKHVRRMRKLFPTFGAEDVNSLEELPQCASTSQTRALVGVGVFGVVR